MACAFTVKQVQDVLRQHLTDVQNRQAGDPNDKNFLKGLLSADQLANELANTIWTAADAKMQKPGTFPVGTIVRRADDSTPHQILGHDNTRQTFTYAGSLAGNDYYNTDSGEIFKNNKNGYEFLPAGSLPSNLENLRLPNKNIDGLTEVLAYNGKKNLISNEDSFIEASQLSLTDAQDIAYTYHKMYKDFLKKAPVVNRANREAIKLMDRQLRDEYPAELKEQYVKQMDYAFMFKGASEFAARMEVIENSILKRQRDYNWEKVKESVYMTKLLTARFLFDAGLTNAMLAMTRKLTFNSQVKSGTEGGNPLTRFFTNTFSKGNLPNLELNRYAGTIASHVIEGGLPINSTMETELGTGGLFQGNVRASEFISNPKGAMGFLISELHRHLARASSRLNNVIDSTTSSYSIEQQHYIFAQDAVIEDSKTKWHVAPVSGTISFFYNGNSGASMMQLDGDDGSIHTFDLTANQMEEYYKLRVKNGAKVRPGDVLAEYHLTGVGLQRRAMAQHFTADYASAVATATDMYENAGMIVVDQGANTSDQINRNSPRFKRSVLDFQRAGRSTERLAVANQIALNDFFKRPVYKYPLKRLQHGTITDLDKMQMIDAGIFGVSAAASKFLSDNTAVGIKVMASFLAGGVKKALGFVGRDFDKDSWEGGSDVFARAVALEMYGFVRGASNFLENMLEFTPYGALKGRLMSNIDTEKGIEGATKQETDFLKQRNYDVYARFVTGSFVTAAIFALQAVLQKMGNCEDVTLTPDDIREGDALIICGHKIPSWWTGMARGNVAIWNIFLNNYEGDVHEYACVMAALSGGKVGGKDLGAIVNTLLIPKNERELATGQRQFEDFVIQATSDVISGFVPLPAGVVREGSSWIAPSSELSPPPNTTTGFIDRVFGKSKWALTQSLGLKEAVLSATEDKPVIDYRARAVLNSYDKYAVGDGIKYDAKDEMLNTLKVQGQDLWNGRMRPLFSATEKGNDLPQRFMTNDEFYNSQYATGKIFNAFLEKNYTDLSSRPPEEARAVITTLLSDLERYSKQTVEDLSPDNWGSYDGYEPPTKEDYINTMMNKLASLSRDRFSEIKLYRKTRGKQGEPVKGLYSIQDIGEVK